MNLINRKIHLFLLSVGEGFRAPSLIAENTGYSYKNTLKTLKELRDMNLIRDVGNHRYEITLLGITVSGMMFELDNLERYGN